jgi:hypothetical protein
MRMILTNKPKEYKKKRKKEKKLQCLHKQIRIKNNNNKLKGTLDLTLAYKGEFCDK